MTLSKTGPIGFDEVRFEVFADGLVPFGMTSRVVRNLCNNNSGPVSLNNARGKKQHTYRITAADLGGGFVGFAAIDGGNIGSVALSRQPFDIDVQITRVALHSTTGELKIWIGAPGNVAPPDNLFLYCYVWNASAGSNNAGTLGEGTGGQVFGNELYSPYPNTREWSSVSAPFIPLTIGTSYRVAFWRIP